MRASAVHDGARARLRRLGAAFLILLSFPPAFLSAQAAAQPQAEDLLAFRFALGGGAAAGPVAAGDRVWVLSEDRTLYVLDGSGRAVGKRAWKEGVPGWIAPDAFGRALLPSSDGSLLLVNRAGLEVYRLRPGGAVPHPPAFGPDGRFFITAGRRLLAYSAGGRLLWSDALAAEAVREPLARHSSSGKTRVALALRNGAVREYDEHGSLLAEIEGPEPPAALADAGDGLALVYRDGTVSVRGEQGQELSRARLAGSPVAACGDGSGVWVLLAGGRAVRVGADGKTGAATDTGVPDARALRVFPERVLVLGPRGAASLSREGEVFRDLALRNAPRLPAVTTSGLVLSAGEDWILYAYRFEKPLGAFPVPDVGYPDYADIRARAEEEAFWNPDFKYDDGILRELRRIEKSAGSGSIGAGEPDALAFCSAIALGYGVREASRYGGAAPAGPRPSSALPRAAACDILGALGSPRAVPVLTEAYLLDPDPAVRAGAAEALGSIGLDPSGQAMRAFQRAADREYFLDDRGALATIGAVEAIYRAQGELSDPAGFQAVLKLAGKPYGSAVRSRALAALRRLSGAAR